MDTDSSTRENYAGPVIEGAAAAAITYFATPMILGVGSDVFYNSPIGEMSIPMLSALAVGGSLAAFGLVTNFALSADNKAKVKAMVGGFGKPIVTAAAASLASYLLMGGAITSPMPILKLAAIGAGAGMLGDKIEDYVDAMNWFY